MTPDASQPDSTRDPALLDEQIVAYLDGEVDEETARRVETLVTSNPALRERLKELSETWELLSELDRPEAASIFTEATLEMVAVEAEADARRREAERPRQRRRRRVIIGGVLLVTGLAGALAGTVLRPDLNRPLLEDLPVIENVDEYIQILGENESADESIDFLRKLHEAKLFIADEDEEDNEANKDASP